MINFRTRSDAGTSIAILIALLVLVITGLVMLFVPPPTTEGTSAGKIRSQKELTERLDKLKSDGAALKTKVDSLVWNEPIEEVGPKALETITKSAQSQRLKLLAFRPQKVQEVNNLTQLPFTISIEGPYPGVMSFIREMAKPEHKLGTSMVQLSGNDPNSDLISATIGVVAYKKLETKKPPVKSNATKKEN